MKRYLKGILVVLIWVVIVLVMYIYPCRQRVKKVAAEATTVLQSYPEVVSSEAANAEIEQDLATVVSEVPAASVEAVDNAVIAQPSRLSCFKQVYYSRHIWAGVISLVMLLLLIRVVRQRG